MKRNYYIITGILGFLLVIKTLFPFKQAIADWELDFLAPTVYIEFCCSSSNTSCTPYSETLPNNQCGQNYLYYRIGCNDGSGRACQDYGKSEVFNSSSCSTYPAPTRIDFLTPTIIDVSRLEGQNIKICASARDQAGNIRRSNNSAASTNGITIVGSWFKLKNTSFHSLTSPLIYIPQAPSTFDSDDNTERKLIIEEEGLVTVIGSSNITPAPTNLRNSYQKTNYFFINQYKSYTETFKDYKLISSPSQLDQLENNKIHFYNGSLTLDNTNISNFNNKNLVLVLINNGSLNINSNFQPTSSSIALLADVINIHPSVSQIEAILIGESISLGDSNTPLKIKGNLISNDPTNPFARERTDNKMRPSMFIVFDPQKYLNLLPLLSRRYYDYQIAQ